MRIYLKFDVVYADPPLRFTTYSAAGSGKCADRHYPRMMIPELKSLPVDSDCAKDSALFMWVCSPSLPLALDVMGSWGFPC